MSEKPDRLQDPLPEYVPPRIVSFTREEIVEQMGPAQACSSFDGMYAPFGVPLDENGLPIPPDRF